MAIAGRDYSWHMPYYFNLKDNKSYIEAGFCRQTIV